MKTFGLALCVLTLGSLCRGHELTATLPIPQATRQQGDPTWLAVAAQFHGHLGPWAAAGSRLGMGARAAVEAHGYFDVRVTCAGPFQQPPNSCFLDGVQVATGATLGKRNLDWAPGEQVVLRLENTRTGRKVEVRPTPRLLELLHSIKPRSKSESAAHDHGAHDHNHDHDHGDQTAKLESIARQIATLPDREIFTVTPVGR